MQSIWWQLFDILGTVAFALSGSMVAISRRMDIFGVFVLTAATAVGGGIVRDIILGQLPPLFFRNSLYFWLIIITMIGTVAFLRYLSGKVRHRIVRYALVIYLVCDAIGLASFTITGTLLGHHFYPHYWILCLSLGVITAVGGGIIRDILAGRIPSTLKQEVYATASIIGAIVLYGMLYIGGIPVFFSAVSCFIITVTVRLVAVFFHWNLPRVRRRKRGQRI